MEIIKENSKTYLKGIMTEANYGMLGTYDLSKRGRNRNRRYYPIDENKRAVLNLKERLLSNNGILSYRNHPNHGDLIYKDSAGIITELDWMEEEARAVVKILVLDDTYSGKKVLEDLSNGVSYGISTRGRGDLDSNNVVSNLNYITADLIPQIKDIYGNDISIQSCQNCNLELTESIQHYYSDFLIESQQKCKCFLDLNLDEKQIVRENLKKEICNIFKNIK